MGNIEILDEEAVKELDRDIAEQFYYDNRSKSQYKTDPLVVPLPGTSILKKDEGPETQSKMLKENSPPNHAAAEDATTNLEKDLKDRRRKSVKFKNIDDDERTWQDGELERLEDRVADLLIEN